jgi:hypothetical protein
MPKRKRPEEKPQDQFKRFVETAKSKNVDSRDAESAFQKIARKTKVPAAKR